MKSNFQKLFDYLGYLMVGIVLAGTIFDTISNSISLITPNVTFLGTICLISIWLFLVWYARTHGITWVLKKGTHVKVTRLRIQVHLFFIGFIFSLWIPKIYHSLQPKKAKLIVETDKFDPADTTNLRILLFPFKPDIDCKELDVDYRGQILENLTVRKETDSLDIKIIKTKELECPSTNNQAKLIGQEKNSDLVIWGSFEEDTKGIKAVRVRYTLIGDFSEHTFEKMGDTKMKPLDSLHQLREGYLQNDINYVIYWIAGMEAYYKNNFRKSLDFFTKIKPDIDSADHPVETFTRLGEVYHALGQDSIALNYLQTVIKIQKSSLDSLNIGLALTYNMLAEIYGGLGDHQERLRMNLKALSIRESAPKKNSSALASIYNDLASTYGALGDYQEQLEYNMKSLATWEKLTPKGSRDLGTSYNNLSVTYTNLGEYEKALEFQNKAHSVMKMVLPNKHPDIGMSFNNFGIIYGYLNNYDQQVEYSLKAVELREQILPENHPDLAISYNNLGVAYSNLKEHEKALEANFKALDIRKSNLPDDHPHIATSYSNLAFNFGGLRNYEKQIEFNLKALKIRENNPNLAPIELVITYNNLAHTYSNLGDYVKNLEYCLKTLETGEKSLPKNHPNLVWFYSNTSIAYRNNGDFDKSIAYSRKAIELGNNSKPQFPKLHLTMITHGLNYLRAGNYLAAKQAFEKSGNLRRSKELYRSWTEYYATLGENNRAIENLTKAVDLGFNDAEWLNSNESLKDIRKTQAFKEIVDGLN